MRIQLTENQLKNIVADSVRRILSEAFYEEETPEAKDKRAEIDAAWREFEEQRMDFMKRMEVSQQWQEFLRGHMKDSEIQDAWENHDGINPRHI